MKIGFVGNSHMLAYKSAEARIRARFPQAELTYMAVSNPDFFRNAVKNTGGLRYDGAATEAGLLKFDLNGPDEMDFGAFDHVFLTSHGFYLGPFLEILATFDILDLRPAGRARLISLPCVRTIIDSRIRYYARRLKAFFPLGPNVTIVQTPYPCEQALSQHPHLADAVSQPDLATVFAMYNKIIATHIEPLDARYVPMPEDACSGPFVTRSKYARALDLPASDRIKEADYSHMNADFALLMVERLLEPRMSD